MGRFPWATTVLVTFIFVGGCSTPFSGDEPMPLPDAESPAPQPSETITRLPPQPNPILIPPTDPDQRLRTLKGGRADPFQSLVPPAKAPTSSSQSSTNARASDRSTTALKAHTGFPDRVGDQFERRSSTPTQKLPAAKASTSTSSQTTTARTGSSKPRSPARPQPNTARGVQVTGIVLVAGVPRAIIKAPGEPVSRSIGPGERLANGRVLVKRIDMNRSEPVVILEQYGTEVALRVGKTSSQLIRL